MMNLAMPLISPEISFSVNKKSPTVSREALGVQVQHKSAGATKSPTPKSGAFEGRSQLVHTEQYRHLQPSWAPTQMTNNQASKEVLTISGHQSEDAQLELFPVRPLE